MSTNLLNGGWFDLEVRLDVTTEYASLQRFDVATNVSFRSYEMPFVHGAVRLLMPVWHDDLATEGFHLCEAGE